MPKKTSQDISPESFKLHDNDTGSVEVQIWILTDEIAELQSHLIGHKKDFDAKRSLLKKVARRRAFLKYLKSKKLSTYAVISKSVSVKV
jgi:small subunit ribosomal protein S15